MKSYLGAILCIALFVQHVYARTSESFAQQLNSRAFVENKGQVKDQYGNPRKDIDFKIESGGVTMFIGNGQLHYQWIRNSGNTNSEILNPKQIPNSKTDIYRLDVELLGANKNAELITEAKGGYYENYYNSGTEDAITSYSYNKIIYKDIYPNIDWVLYCKEGKLKYDFIVHRGGNINNIRLQYNGATGITLKEGALVATTPFGTITEEAPYSYYEGSKQEAKTNFVLSGNILSYTAPSSNAPSGTLIIDPAITWGTYFGGLGAEGAYFRCSTDTFGNVYFATIAYSANLATSGAYITTLNNVGGDGLIAKFSIGGSLVWCTYSGSINLQTIAVDRHEGVYVLGRTDSPGRATIGAHQAALAGGRDVFLMKLNTTGFRIWATYYGGSLNDEYGDVTCDIADNVYVVGLTKSTSGIATTGAFQTSPGDGFLVKFNSFGVRQWATYFNGLSNDVTTDNSLNIYIAGGTMATTGIATPGAYQTSLGATLSHNDGFILQFNTAGVRLWGTYYGTSLGTGFARVAVDSAGNIYAAGSTACKTGIATPNAYKPFYSGGHYSNFMVKFNGYYQRRWATYLMNPYDDTSSLHDQLNTLMIDNKGYPYIAGQTHGGNIATPGAYMTTLSGALDACYMRFDNLGNRIYGTYYGGSGYDRFCDVSMGGNKIYMVGNTSSPSGIATPGAYKTAWSGIYQDYFLIQVQADTSIFLSAPFTDTLVCSGDMLNVKFGASPDMRAGNVFIVQLSDTVGSFTSPTTIASIGGVKGGTLAWPVPANIVASNKYQLRIISTKPADTIMLDYVFTLLPTKAPTITIAANPGTHVWPGLNVTFNAAITNGGDTPSYQWRINGANVPGATANPWSTMGIKNNDKVSCVLTSNYPCASPGKDTSNILDMKVAVGISNVEQDSYHIYPNPTNEILYIEGLTPNSTIQLFDVYGRLIYHSIATQKNEAINTSLFAPGNYILQITDPDGERTTRKVVKE